MSFAATLNVSRWAARRGAPISYLTGHKLFLGRVFEITPDVLVPRAYTEDLVRLVLEHARRSGASGLQVLDMGTGSGCIAISLAKELEGTDCSVHAADVSAGALSVARRNALRLDAEIRPVESDLFSNVAGRFDLIVANLPYVPLRKYRRLFHSLRHEPQRAVCDGTNHWRIFKYFFAQSRSHVTRCARIFLEIDPDSRFLLTRWADRYLSPKTLIFHRGSDNVERFLQIVMP